jgi:hypothetical protein
MPPLERLILGSNAFEGVSYTSRTQSLHFLEHFGKPENIVAVLTAAHNLGVKTFMLSNTENVMAALEKFDKSGELTLLPVIPNVYEYARDASEKGVLGTVLDKAKRIDMYQKIRFGLRALGKIKSVISKDVLSLLVELIDFELASFKPYKLGGVLLHGQVTDLALSSHNKGILELFLNLIRDSYELEPMLATHNFGTLLPQLIEWGIKVPVMAPLNQKGFMMKPSQEACLKLVQESGYPIIAKKVLAGGRLTPEEGFGFLADKKIISVVVGIGSVPEAYHTLSVGKMALKAAAG